MRILRYLPLLLLAGCSSAPIAPEPIEHPLGCALTYSLPNQELWEELTAVRGTHRADQASTSHADPFNIDGLAELHAADISAMRAALLANGTIKPRVAEPPRAPVESVEPDGPWTGYACGRILYDPERWREVGRRDVSPSEPESAEKPKDQ
jgi:hypothetical protein